MGNKEKAGGIGFLGLLALIFITLKLIGIIAWSWFWVLSPIILPLILVVGTIGIIFLISVIKGAFDK